MKNKLSIILPLTVLAFGAASAQSTWYTTGSGNREIDDLADWTDQSDGTAGTSPAAQPVSGDTDTWVIRGNNRLSAQPSNTAWFGGTLQVLDVPTNDGEFQLWNENFTVQDVILDGGALNVGNGLKTLTGNTLTLNSGIIGHESTNLTNKMGQFDFETYTGSGNILLQGRGNGSTSTTQNGRVLFVNNLGVGTKAGDFSTFTGSFTIQAGTLAGFDYDITTATFSLAVDVAGGTHQGRYNLLNDVSVTTLQAGPDFLPAGTYTLDTATNPGATDLTNVGGTDYSVYFADNGGTITATTTGTITPPVVTQEPAESIDETIASIPGTVTDTWGETPTLTVYIGATDGMDVPGAWDTPVSFGPTFGAFYADLTGLTNNTTYFYRCRVTNSATTSDSEGWAAPSGTFTTGTVPDPVVSAQNGNITDSTTWTGSPPVPTSGTSDTKTWRILHQVDRGTDPATFAGQTLEIGDGVSDDGELRLEPLNGTLTVRDVVLNPNGVIFQDNNNNTLTGDTLTFTGDGGHIGPARIGGGSEAMALNFETFTGDGTVYIFGNNANGDRNLVIQTTSANPGTAMQGFTGTLHRDRLNGAGGGIAFDFSVTVATFAIKLADTDSDLPPATGNGGAKDFADGPQFTGKLYLTDGVDVMVTELHLYDEESDGSVHLDVHLPDGTYTLDTGTNPGATDLTNVGGNDYSRFFKGGSGTVTVSSGTTPSADPVIVDVRHLGATVELDLEGLDSAETYKVYRDTVLPLSGSKVQVGADVTSSTTATVTDNGPLPTDAYYQAEQQ